MKLTKKLQAELVSAAKKAAPNEMCGLLVVQEGRLKFVPTENKAANPVEHFEIAPEEWAVAEATGEIAAVVHSHAAEYPRLSGADRQIHARQKLPWVLVCGGKVRVYRACPHLRGRVFEYGKADCGTLIRDALMIGGVEIPDAVRTEIDDDAEQDAWLNYLQGDSGFKQVSDGLTAIEPGDVVLTAFGGHANHAALYLGGNEMLHHAYDQLSRREPFGIFWQNRVHSVWRHSEPVDIQAILNDLEHSE